MNEDDRKLWYSRRLSFVPRWVVVPTIRHQNVAEHCFHVGALANWLMKRHARFDDPYFRGLVLTACLEHDLDEAVTGDHPGPTKDGTRKKPEELTDVEIVVKTADKLEAVLFCLEETQMGNEVPMRRIREDALRRLNTYWERFDWDYSHNKPSALGLVREIQGFSNFDRHPILDK